jgi:hypothetical protein
MATKSGRTRGSDSARAVGLVCKTRDVVGQNLNSDMVEVDRKNSMWSG